MVRTLGVRIYLHPPFSLDGIYILLQHFMPILGICASEWRILDYEYTFITIVSCFSPSTLDGFCFPPRL